MEVVHSPQSGRHTVGASIEENPSQKAKKKDPISFFSRKLSFAVRTVFAARGSYTGTEQVSVVLIFS
jgi:hypothetical protein